MTLILVCGPDYRVYYVALPHRVHAVVLPCSDNSFDIYINLSLPEACQREALRHELEHIRRDHFYDTNPVSQNELEAG